MGGQRALLKNDCLRLWPQEYCCCCCSPGPECGCESGQIAGLKERSHCQSEEQGTERPAFWYCVCVPVNKKEPSIRMGGED